MNRLHSERGQTLIQLAVMMIVLLGIAALAIDIGNGYLQRRRMQNAADAAALAGAFELCRFQTPEVAASTARRYLMKNGVTEAFASSSVTVTGGTVAALARSNTDVAFGGALGGSAFTVAAGAEAQCGASTTACGLIPIAFDVDLYAAVDCVDGLIMVWDGDNTHKLGEDCPGVPPDQWCSECYVCEYDVAGGDAEPFEVMTDLSRGWVDFSSLVIPPYVEWCTGGGTSELVCRMKNGSAAPLGVGACIDSVKGEGVMAGAKKGVEYLASTGKYSSIPLFDDINCRGESSETRAESFHIGGFGCVQTVAWEQSYKLELRAGGETKSGKMIVVRKTCSGACENTCGSTDGGLPEPWELRSVGLTR